MFNFDRITLRTKFCCIVKDEGNAEPCFVSACLEQNKTASGQGLSEELIKDTAAVAYAAGQFVSISFRIPILMNLIIRC